MPQYSGYGNGKNARLHRTLNQINADIICFSELNVAWNLIPHQDRFEQRMSTWWKGCRSIAASFQKCTTLKVIKTPRQPGGCAIVVRNHMAGHVETMGKDPSGMARWVWARLRRKGDRFLTVFSCYRPTKNTTDAFSTYQQQYEALILKTHDEAICPRTQFDKDFAVELARFREMGDEISIYIDLNDDTRSASAFNSEMESASMREVLLERHRQMAPNTHQDGSRPIDGIYCSALLPITRSAYLPFYEGHSDHRPLLCDIPSAYLLNLQYTPQSKFRGRRLQNDDPRVVKKYQDRYDQFLSQHNLYERAQTLADSIAGELTVQQQMEYEEIDSLRLAGTLFAERKCRKIKRGQVDWSPQLEMALDIHRFWDLLTKRLSGKRVGYQRLKRLAKQVGLTSKLHSTQEESKLRRNEAWDAYKQVKEVAEKLREDWLQERAKAREDAGLEPLGKGFRMGLNREKARKNHRIINRATKSGNARSLTRVTTTTVDLDGSTVIHEHTTKPDIEQAGLVEYDNRLRQANDRPLQHPTAISLLGLDGCSAQATEILETGRVPEALAALDPLMTEYLQAHHVHPRPPEIDPAIPVDHHCQGWQRSKERTSSGRSGMHFGHMIAGTSHPDIAQFEATLSSIPWETGYSPKRWAQGLNVMIEKKPGDIDVAKLRTILLLEPDFNQGNKWLGKNLMANAEQEFLLAPEQYGSRKFHEAVNQALNKVLTFNILRQLKQPGALCSNDAKSCYDRILHVAAAMAMRRVGASKSAVHCMLTTLQNLKHYIRTSYGDSIQYFDANDGSGVPIHGTGQGNGASPAIWALVSTPIFDAMRRRGYGVFLQCPLTGKMLQFVGYAFVDDCDLCVTHGNVEQLDSSIFEKIQQSVHLWEGFIAISGGAIVPEKSHWYMIDFQWHPDGTWSYKPILESDPDLVVKDKDGKEVIIERVPLHEGRRTVGVRIAPDGNMDDETAYLISEATKWAEKIRISKLPRDLVWMAMQTGIMRKLMYSLPATTLSEKQCQDIMAPLLKVALPKSSLNRHFPRALLYAPFDAGGIGLSHLYVEQGIQHLKRFFQLAELPGNINGHLLSTSLECLAMEIGCEHNPLLESYALYQDCAMPTWIRHLWEFCTKYSIKVLFPLDGATPLRYADQTIMSKLGQTGQYSSAEIAVLNRCRLYLQIARVSDMVTADGRSIIASILQGRKDNVAHCEHPVSWPNQGPPGRHEWTQWTNALTTAFGLVFPSRRLSTPLGSWTQSWTKWKWFITNQGTVLSNMDCKWELHLNLHRNVFAREGTGISFAQVINLFPLRRTTISPGPHGLIATSTDTREIWWEEEQETVLPIPRMSLFEYQCNGLRQRLAWTQQLEFEPMTNQVIAKLLHAFQAPGAVAVSDGSPKDGKGAAAWIIAEHLPADGTLIDMTAISGGFLVPGAAEYQDSYRCELAGLIAILTVLREFSRQFHRRALFLSIACDGKGALQRLFAQERPASLTDSQWDMISWAQLLLRDMPELTLYWHHVKGHQDDVATAELDQWAQLNIEMDLYAKHSRTTLHDSPFITMYEAMPKLSLGQESVSSTVFESLRSHCLSPPALQYWQTHGRVGQGEITDINWTRLGVAIHEMDMYRRRFVTKHSCGWCGVGSKLKLWKFESEDLCPRCAAPNETAEHVWLCQEESTETLWHAKLQELEHWLASVDTAPPVLEAIVSNFKAWRGGARHKAPKSKLPGLLQAVEKQTRVGWTAAFEGRWVVEFEAIQARYYKFMHMRRTGKRWVVALIKKTWEIAWSLWQHRNRIQEKVREAKLRATLKEQATAIFAQGPLGIHPASRRLFSHKTLEERLQQRTSDLHAWVLRVQAAQERAAADPQRMAAEAAAQQARAARDQRRAVRLVALATAERARQRQASMFESWRTPPTI